MEERIEKALGFAEDISRAILRARTIDSVRITVARSEQFELFCKINSLLLKDMTYLSYSRGLAFVVWITFVSITRADAPVATIEIVGAKMSDRNYITVEVKEKNISHNIIKINRIFGCD
jgi:hypothetical protein